MGSNEFDESQISEKRSSKQKKKNITIYFQHNPIVILYTKTKQMHS